MKKLLCKNLIIFLSLIAASCSSQNDQQTKIRIVDLQGKSHPVVTRFPELNEQALASQGKMREEKSSFVQQDMQKSPSNIAENSSQNQQTPSINQNMAQNNAPDYSAVTPPVGPQITSSPDISRAQKPVEIVEDTKINAGRRQEKEQVVEYDLAKSDHEVKSKPQQGRKLKFVKQEPSDMGAQKLSAPKMAKKGIFVQVGSFSSLSNANNALSAMEKFHKGMIETVEGEKTIYRTLLGPFSNKQQAVEMVKKIKSSGHDAIVVRNK